MKIDGRLIATHIKNQLKLESEQLKNRGIVPHLAVILVGSDPASITYVDQKKKAAEEVGAKVTLYNLPTTTQLFEIKKLLFSLNTDQSVHGIIVQRPLYSLNITKDMADVLVVPSKDVDGFHPDSSFTPPIAQAVMKILQWIAQDVATNPMSPLKQNFAESFRTWIEKQRILIIGRGETAGAPIVATLAKSGIKVDVAHSTTKFMDALLRNSNIVISCVGKSNIVRHKDISSKTILIGVGLHTEKGRLSPDYEQDEVEPIAAYFTPVPGGIGPVNVACLFENLFKAASNSVAGK